MPSHLVEKWKFVAPCFSGKTPLSVIAVQAGIQRIRRKTEFLLVQEQEAASFNCNVPEM